MDDEQVLFSNFEAGVQAILDGDVATLEKLLSENPELIRTRSPRKHGATLLHYVAANGVERQRTPENAVEVALVLLNAGAAVDALADTYGGGKDQTTLNLLVSSCHPAKAGVQVGLVETLLDFGAAINGLEDDSSPLITALAFHYPKAAEALARRGAKVESVVAAAGLGRTDLVESFLDDNGDLKPSVPLVNVSWLELQRDPKANLELALVWAAMHHRTNVVGLLLKQGVSPAARDNRQSTALHWTACYGYLDTTRVLLDWKAPLEAQNQFGGTVLGQMTWCVINEPAGHHAQTIEMLLNAGANPENADYPTGNEQVDGLLKRYGAKLNRSPLDLFKSRIQNADREAFEQLLRDNSDLVQQHWPGWEGVGTEAMIAEARVLLEKRQTLLDSITRMRDEGISVELAEVLRNLAELARSLPGEDAEQRYKEAVGLFREFDEPLKLAHTIRHLGDVYRHANKTVLAEACYVEALAIYRSHKDTPPLDVANAIRSHAVLKEAGGDRQHARALWQEAHDLYLGVGVGAGVSESAARLALPADPEDDIQQSQE